MGVRDAWIQILRAGKARVGKSFQNRGGTIEQPGRPAVSKRHVGGEARRRRPGGEKQLLPRRNCLGGARRAAGGKALCRYDSHEQGGSSAAKSDHGAGRLLGPIVDRDADAHRPIMNPEEALPGKSGGKLCLRDGAGWRAREEVVRILTGREKR